MNTKKELSEADWEEIKREDREWEGREAQRDYDEEYGYQY